MSGSPETERPSQQSIVEQAKSDSLAFFGTERPIPQPPVLLLKTLRNLHAIGLLESQAVFIPEASLNQGANFPGWHIKISPWYYEQLAKGQIAKASPELSGIWAIVDTNRRPDYAQVKEWRERWKGIQNGTFQRSTYEPEPKDEIERIIQEARLRQEIVIIDTVYKKSDDETLPYLPTTSRFGVSTDEQDGVVFPALGEKIGLTEAINSGKAVIRRPTLAEFNYLGNLFRFMHLGELTTLEAVEDVYKGIIDINKPGPLGFPRRAIVSGNIKQGGVAQADYIQTVDHTDAVSFRYIIAFT